MDQVSNIVAPLYAASERALVISVRGDREVPYRFMDQVQQELVAAGVVRVVFATQLEQSMQRERR
jgi:biopolymer transport protein ExbD